MADNSIKLKNITKRYGKSVAVDHLDLEIPANSFISLLGPSGCGKTTTLRMIAGLETPTEGEIWIGDQLVFQLKRGSMCRRMNEAWASCSRTMRCGPI